MKSILLSLALVALIGQGWAEETQAPAGGLFGGRLQGVVEPRLAANAIRIHDLEEHIEKLKGKIEQAKHADPQRFINDLKARLTELEGTHCDEHEFQCGNNGQECISDLFVCDGHKDCHNGHDEDKETCHEPSIKAGNTFSGIVHWTDCVNLDDHTHHLTIIGTRRVNYFTSRIGVHAVSTAVYKDKNGEEVKKHFEVFGGYNYANRRLYLAPKGNDGRVLALACVFDHGDDERLDCTLQATASEHQCAESHLTLQHTSFEDDHKEDHHDDDDDDDDDEHDNYFDKLFKHGQDDDDDDHDDDDDDDDHHHRRRHHKRHHRDH